VLGTATLSGSSSTATASLSIKGDAAGLSSGSNTITASYSGDNANHAATAKAVLNLVSKSAANPTITGLVDSASYREAYAPGMALSIFGSNLALSTRGASSTPLPTEMDNVSVKINGVAAPLYYISPTQLNVQIPYETPTSGTVTVVVSDNNQAASAKMKMSAVAPGIFTDGSGGISSTTATAGQNVTIYVNGAGALDPSVATGSTPTAGSTSTPRGATLVTVRGLAASTSYVGEPNWSVGILQINFTVPFGVGTGTVPVVVSIGGVASVSASLTVSR
jgi:uncharacterized protein (TIGR03437 family)